MADYMSTTDEFMNKADSVCRHWVSKKQVCYACKRERDMVESKFQPVECRSVKNPVAPPSFCLDGKQTSSGMMYSRTLKSDKPSYSMPQTGPKDWQFYNQAPSGYRHPDNVDPKAYPLPVDVPDPRRFMDHGRDDPRRSETPHKGVMLDRALAMADFLPPSGYQAYFGQQPTRQQQASVRIPGGATTSRPEKKIEPRTYLDRDLVQPDMRYGNRFFEILPEDTRKLKQSHDINERTNDRDVASNHLYRAMESQYPLSTQHGYKN